MLSVSQRIASEVCGLFQLHQWGCFTHSDFQKVVRDNLTRVTFVCVFLNPRSQSTKISSVADSFPFILFSPESNTVLHIFFQFISHAENGFGNSQSVAVNTRRFSTRDKESTIN